VRQRDQIRSLPTAGRTVAESTQAARADTNDMAKPLGWEAASVFFPSRACKHVLPGSE